MEKVGKRGSKFRKLDEIMKIIGNEKKNPKVNAVHGFSGKGGVNVN